MDRKAEEEIKLTRTYQRLVEGTNINANTLLATDYLNHFNEVIMMLDMVPDMAECLEEAKEWQPMTYAEHFTHSTFSDRELAVLAYENAPAEYREPFDATTEEINEGVRQGIETIEAVLAEGHEDKLRETVAVTTREIQQLLDRASAIINGDYEKEEAAESITLDQDDIDALFD